MAQLDLNHSFELLHVASELLLMAPNWGDYSRTVSFLTYNVLFNCLQVFAEETQWEIVEFCKKEGLVLLADEVGWHLYLFPYS